MYIDTIASRVYILFTFLAKVLAQVFLSHVYIPPPQPYLEVNQLTAN